MASKKQVLHVRSNVTTQDSSTGILTPKQPTSLDFGELAVNYAQGAETIFLKNSGNEIVGVSNKVEVGEENPSSTNIELFVDTSDTTSYDVYSKAEVDSLFAKLVQLNPDLNWN